jgi:hypothetical protein
MASVIHSAVPRRFDRQRSMAVGPEIVVPLMGTYTATIPAASLPATDGPFAVNVADLRMRGQLRVTATQTLTLGPRHAVAMPTAFEGGDINDQRGGRRGRQS